MQIAGAEGHAAHRLDQRNDDGWSPDLAATGPVHLTATFAQPIRTGATPYLTAQLNFGSGKSLVPGLIELFVLTGTDDGTDLPPGIDVWSSTDTRSTTMAVDPGLSSLIAPAS